MGITLFLESSNSPNDINYININHTVQEFIANYFHHWKKDRGWSKWVVFEKDHDLQKIVSIIYLMKQLLSFDSEKVCFCTFENLIHRNLSNLNLE